MAEVPRTSVDEERKMVWMSSRGVFVPAEEPSLSMPHACSCRQRYQLPGNQAPVGDWGQLPPPWTHIYPGAMPFLPGAVVLVCLSGQERPTAPSAAPNSAPGSRHATAFS